MTVDCPRVIGLLLQAFFARQADETLYGRDAFWPVRPLSTKIFVGVPFVVN